MKTLVILALCSLTLATAADINQDQQIQKRSLVVKDRIEVIERIDVTAQKPVREVEDADAEVMAILEEMDQLESEGSSLQRPYSTKIESPL